MKSIFLKIAAGVRAILLPLACAFATVSATAGDSTSPYDGLFGRSLKNAIAANKPAQRVPAVTAQGELFSLSGNICHYSSEPIKSLVYDHYLPPAWIVTPTDMADMLKYDMHNIAVADASASTLRNGLPFGKVATPTTSAYGCTVGNTTGRNTVFEPADAQKGALARRFFYFASLYPAELWEGNGAVVFNDFEPYPTLSPAMAEVYLEWNLAYPPAESEKELNNRIEQLQGNRNVFVDYPELAEHIWGSKKNMPYGNSGNSDRPGVTRQPLKSRYLTTETIWLWWPAAEDDATWSVDGKRTVAESIKASDLGTGQHEVEFVGSRRRGRIIINIEAE